MSKRTYTANMEADGTLSIEGVPLLSLAWAMGKRLIVTVEKYTRNRSNAQNRYLWGVCYPLIQRHIHQTSGERYDAETIHDWVKQTVLGIKPRTVVIMGIPAWCSGGKKTTSKQTTVEFMDSVATIQEFFAERGLNIPDPHEANTLSDIYTNHINQHNE